MPANNHQPYIGPRPFCREEKGLFFGRDREARDLRSLVIAHPIVLLYAASGAGKSSLLNAGLIPLLEERGCEVMPPAHVKGDIPDVLKGADVGNVYAFNVLSSLAGSSAEPQELANMELSGFLASRPHRRDEAGEPVLRIVIIDQFEELFTFAPEHWREREGLIRQLADALNADPLLRIVLGMREEFIAPLDTYASLLPQELRTRIALSPLGPDAARQAIERPLERTDRSFDPEASQWLGNELLKIHVKDVSGEPLETVGPFVEPLQLQVVCTKLWESLPPDIQTITPDHIKDFGDVNEALKQFYEDALKATVERTRVSDDNLRGWVSRYLITPGDTRGLVYRGPEKTGREEGAIPNAAVDVLEEKHLIRAEARAGGERWYELIHDRFIEPIKESNRIWRAQYELRLRKRKLRKLSLIIASSLVLSLAGTWIYPQWRDYKNGTLPIKRLLALDKKDHQAAIIKAPFVLSNVAAHLWKHDNLEKLTQLLKQVEPLIPEQLREDLWTGAVMPQVADDEEWPIELLYNPARKLDRGRLLYQWRVMARHLVDRWGIPAPAALKLTDDSSLPVDDLEVSAGNEKGNVAIPSKPGFVLISEAGMPEKLRPWFDVCKKDWERVDELKYGGPWWLVPRWTQPLFDVANWQASPREAAIAIAIGNRLIAQPELALKHQNVARILRRLEKKGFEHTVNEALAARGGIDGLVDDLRAIVAAGYPLRNLEYVLDNLANYPRSRYSSRSAAEQVVADQMMEMPPLPRLIGARDARPAEDLAKFTHAQDILPYRDTIAFIDIEPPVRIYFGRKLEPSISTPEEKLRPEILETLADFRGEIFKRFGIVVPGMRFRPQESDPSGKLADNAFRIELLFQTQADPDTSAIEVTDPGQAIEQLLSELRWRLLALRTWWITADYVDQQLASNGKLRSWLLDHYSLTSIKHLLRGVVAPSDSELDAYAADMVDIEALQHTVPGQSLRKLDWLLASLVFWSQAGDAHDTAQLVKALRSTQAARLAPQGQPAREKPSAALLAGIEALENQDFPRAERRFREALTADRRGAIAAFAASYANRESMTVNGEVNKFIAACTPIEPPGTLNKNRPSIAQLQRFEIEDFLGRHGEAINDANQTRLEYCLLDNYAANDYPGHMRASLKKLSQPKYSSHLDASQKYAIGYWTLELGGRGFAASPDQEKAEEWLKTAFHEWGAKDEEIASDAFRELFSRYSWTVPAWYVRMLEKLAGERPKNFYIAYDMGNYLLDSAKNADDIDKAITWLIQADSLIEPTVPQDDRPRLKTWVDYGIAKSRLSKAKLIGGKSREESEQEALEAATLLHALIRQMKPDQVTNKDEWPGAAAYSSLIEAYEFRNEFAKAAEVLDASHRDGLGEDPANSVTLMLAADRADNAVQLARRAQEMPGVDRTTALFFMAMSELITGQPDAERAARELIATGHPYRDYIRLMLFWYLARQEKTDQARAYLEERWRNINPQSWPARLANGDPQVWRERLIGYYLGQVKRDEIFVPLESPEAFASSKLDRIGSNEGLTLDGMRCEAYFYDALLQDVSGDPATRPKRYTQSLRRVLEVGNGIMIEYKMARFLLKQVIPKG